MQVTFGLEIVDGLNTERIISCWRSDISIVYVTSLQVTFGTLFNDDRCANLFEALVGTLRAAKKRKVVKYDSEMLLQGVHDDVEITLLQA